MSTVYRTFVINLPGDVEREAVHRYFYLSLGADAKEVYIRRMPFRGGNLLSYAILEFDNEETAKSLCNDNGMKFDGRPMTITYPVKKSELTGFNFTESLTPLKRDITHPFCTSGDSCCGEEEITTLPPSTIEISPPDQFQADASLSNILSPPDRFQLQAHTSLSNILSTLNDSSSIPAKPNSTPEAIVSLKRKREYIISCIETTQLCCQISSSFLWKISFLCTQIETSRHGFNSDPVITTTGSAFTGTFVSGRFEIPDLTQLSVRSSIVTLCCTTSIGSE